MSELIVTFGRVGNEPVMRGRNVRTESITISGTAALSDMVCDPGSFNQENVADILAQANCWVQIGATPVAEGTGTDPYNTSIYMAATERLQFAIQKGDRVSVVAA